MTTLPEMKKALLIGDPYLALIGAAAGIDYYIYKDDCNELTSLLLDKIKEYGLVIVLRRILKSCMDLKQLLETHGNVLTIVIDSPREIVEIDPRSYYEEIMVKYIGLKFELK